MILTEKKYEIYNDKIKQNYRVVSITDIHSNYKSLAKIAKELENISPDLIVISGDIIDSIDNPNNAIMLDVLKLISKYVPTFISYGNHDTVTFEYDKMVGYKEIDTHNEEFFNSLKNQTNCIVLGNTGMEKFKDLIIRAYNLPTDKWYEHGELKEQFEEEFNRTYCEMINQIAKHEYTILSSHSPNGYLTKKGEFNKHLKQHLLDTLILSGHNHGGMIPPKIQELISHTSLKGIGLVGPYGKFCFRNAYGYFNDGSTNLILSDGVTISSEHYGKLGEIVNKIINSEIDIIDLKNGESAIRYEGYKVKKLQ